MCQTWKKPRKKRNQLIHNTRRLNLNFHNRLRVYWKIFRERSVKMFFFIDLRQTQLPEHMSNLEAISQTAQSANPRAHDG